MSTRLKNALHTERERTSKLREELESALTQLKRAEETLGDVVRQRDRFEQDAREYGVTLSKVLDAIGVTLAGAREEAAGANSRAYERMSVGVVGEKLWTASATKED